jgi:hypothetical protein
MRKLLLPALALLALSACNNKAKNEAAEANETMAGDSNTMGEAVADVNAANAAMDNAFSDAETSYANATPAEDGGAASNEITD